MNIFINTQNQLRSIWWVAVFFLVLASLTFPLIFLSQQYGWEVTITQQAIVVIAATWICQLMRKKPISELLGKPDLIAIKNCFLGLVSGALLMLMPAMFLTMIGYVHWQQGSAEMSSIIGISGVFVSVAVAEEFLFRGFIFQRLRSSTGIWIAQLLIAGYFLLTHMGNPGMTNSTKMLGSINIFIASIMFGFAFIRTNTLIMPIAMHFMANWVQGTLLGFGVSGNEQASLMKPVFSNAPQWLTGGSFGLEASVPGLVCVIVTTLLLYRWKPTHPGKQLITGKRKEENINSPLQIF
ncbi:MAG: CPBP family intramembrane glutamic endopeptidase [Flavitalea sp.]